MHAASGKWAEIVPFGAVSQKTLVFYVLCVPDFLKFLFDKSKFRMENKINVCVR